MKLFLACDVIQVKIWKHSGYKRFIKGEIVYLILTCYRSLNLISTGLYRQFLVILNLVMYFFYEIQHIVQLNYQYIE